MNRNNREVVFEIIKHIGVIAEYQTGWKKEVNIVSWNNNKPKYDIREWDENQQFMSRGLTLTKEEMEKVVELVIDEREF